MKAILLLVLVPSIALAQALPQYLKKSGGYVNGPVRSTVPSGTTAFGCTTNGCVWDFGAGATDTATSDGTYVIFGSPVKFRQGNITFDGGGASFSAPSLILGGTTLSLRGQNADSASAVGVILDNNPAFSTLGAKLVSFRNNTVEKASFRLDGALSLVGVATASLPTCNAGMAGTQQYDTTSKTVKLCDGTAWREYGSKTWSAFKPTANFPTSTGFGVMQAGDALTGVQLAWIPTTAGAGAGTITLELYDLTTTTSKCTMTFSCANSVGFASTAACTATAAAGDNLAFRISTDGCTASSQPIGNASFTYR